MTNEITEKEMQRHIAWIKCNAIGNVKALNIDVPVLLTLIAKVESLAADAERPAVWKPLNDVQWMNIVNHDRAWENSDKEEAVHGAVKMTEAKCKEVNGAVNKQLVAALLNLLGNSGYTTMTDDELREEERLGNGNAPIILAARAALAAAGVKGE